MVTDAEARLAELHAEQGYATGLFKMKDDPRITKPGKWLRRFSVDELPQLINVLRGDMSLVGPRPPLPLEVATYSVEAHRRLRVRPGMTGLWQVSGRSDLSWSEAIRLDLYYVDNWSRRTLAARGWTRDGGDLYDVLARLDSEGCARYVATVGSTRTACSGAQPRPAA